MQHLHRVRPPLDRPHQPSLLPRPESTTGATMLVDRLRPAGNAAITSLIRGSVQRQGVDPAPPLLTPAKVADARQYYTSQPTQYPPAIITQHRTGGRGRHHRWQPGACGRPPTGRWAGPPDRARRQSPPRRRTVTSLSDALDALRGGLLGGMFDAAQDDIDAAVRELHQSPGSSSS